MSLKYVMALEKELKSYKEHIHEWSEHEGQYVLIKDESAAGFFSSYDDALRAGYEKFKLEPFLVKRVSSLDHVHFVSRLFDPCHSSPSK